MADAVHGMAKLAAAKKCLIRFIVLTTPEVLWWLRGERLRCNPVVADTPLNRAALTLRSARRYSRRLLFRTLRWAIASSVMIIVGGTLGFRFIEGWRWVDSLWMTVITLTTIGYSEPNMLSDAGRWFTMGLIVAGLGLGTYTLGQVTKYVVEGEFRQDLRERRRRNLMRKLENHFIVVGLGRLGREVAEELHHRGHQVVAIEVEAETSDRLPFLDLRLKGDGSSDEILNEAAINRARGIAAATGSDATNIFVTLSARQMNPRIHIITRVDDEASVQKAFRAGANAVINPYGISGARMAQGMIHPHAAQLLDRAVGRAHNEFEIEDVAIGEVEHYNGRLGELDIPDRHGVLIVAIRRPDGQLITRLDRHTELRAGDIAIVVGRPADVRMLAEAVMDGAV